MVDKLHKRVAGNCDCKSPLVCSVLSNRFWCGKCGKKVKSLSPEKLRFVHGCKSIDELIIKIVGMDNAVSPAQ